MTMMMNMSREEMMVLYKNGDGYDWQQRNSTPNDVAFTNKDGALTSMDTPEGTRKWLFYTFLGIIADALDLILTSVIPDKRPQTSIGVSKFYSLALLHPPVLT